MEEKPRLRFAPSPTGFLHVGGARTALFNWLYARKLGGSFVLRIEDTDRERSRAELTEAILDGLDWLGLDWDEGPYHQADNIERHREQVEKLLAGGAAYRCFCTAERLEELRAAVKERGTTVAYDGRCRDLSPAEADRRAAGGAPHTVRFRIPEGETTWDDVVAGRTRFANADIEDFILLRSDGTPTYNLAVVSDDLLMKITHVIRGADHISNTPKQIQIYRALAAELPLFCHVPLILGPDGKRLSKRHGAASVSEYRAAGFLPQAMDNFLALLGWSPGDDVEFMEIDELIARFSLERINKKPAIFDHDKLEWLNSQHLSRSPSAELATSIAPLLAEREIVGATSSPIDAEWFEQVIDLLKVRTRTLTELVERARPFFPGHLEPEAEAESKYFKDKELSAQLLGRLRAAFAVQSDWSEAQLERSLRTLAEEMNVGAGKLIHPLRVALTGSLVSPGIFELMHLMGRDLVFERIDDAIQRLTDVRAD